MSKSFSAPLVRTARLLDLVPFLNTHQGIALKELATHFGVTTSQMSADLTTLWMCGLPGYTPLELMDLEFESGYVTIRNADTLARPRTISFQEGVALLLALDLLQSHVPSDRADLSAIIESLKSRLSNLLGVPVNVSISPTSTLQVSTVISKALESNSGLSLEYHSIYKDVVTKRVVSPVNHYEVEGNYYLRAYCFTANDFREFRVDRINSATLVPVPSVSARSTSGSDKISYSITAKSPSRDVAERFALAELPIEEEIQLSSYSRQWIERSVMASGSSVALNSPVEIRKEIATKAQLILDRYKGH